MIVGTVQGYIITGQMVQPPSYEAFISILQTMTVQSAEFAGPATEANLQFPNTQLPRDLRLGRQERSGFSYQNPTFIGTVLNLKVSLLICRVYTTEDRGGREQIVLFTRPVSPSLRLCALFAIQINFLFRSLPCVRDLLPQMTWLAPAAPATGRL